MAIPEYEDMDATELARRVAARELSAGELAEEAIRRIELLDGELNALVDRDFERARATAKQQDEQPTSAPLRGVPFLLKDLAAEEVGRPTTSGSRFLADTIADHDAEMVLRLRGAGLNVLGRTNTPEFGIKGVTEPSLRGPTKNPWALDRSPGGSSGGSAAAVAARFVPMAHGGDGGGSLRIPAACCGLVGLKPTRARTPAGPVRGEFGWGGFAVEHAITRTVRDSALLLDLTCGPDAGAPYHVEAPSQPYAAEVEAGVAEASRRLRIAYSAQALFSDRTDPECERALHDAVGLARALGHEVVEAKPEFDMAEMRRAYLIVVAAGIAASVGDAAWTLRRQPKWQDLEPATWFLVHVGRQLRAEEYVANQRRIHATSRKVAQFFERHDLFLTPTCAKPPVRIGELDETRIEIASVRMLTKFPSRRASLAALEQMAENAFAATSNTMLFNMTGQPAVSLPLHWSEEGLPIGTQWVGRFGDEATVLRVAAELERARPWVHRKPPLLG